MSQSIAVINAGSSSIKFALYDAVREEICLFRGQIGGIGVAPRLKVADPKGEIVEERAFSSEGFDHDAAMREILSVGAKLLRGEPVAAFGHRVVHGGVRYDSPVRVTSDVLDDLARLAPLAPLHQPHNLAPIRTILNVAPQIPQGPASTRPFIAGNRILLRHSPCRVGLLTPAFGATGFTACLMSFL